LYRIDGAEVFANKAALAGNPLVAIDLDESGADTELVPDGAGSPTFRGPATVANGTHSTNTCNEWSSNSDVAHGMAGANTATTNAKWSEVHRAAVQLTRYHLYCFEQ